MVEDKNIRDVFGKPTIDFHWMQDSETGRTAFVYKRERLAMIDKNGIILNITSDSKSYYNPPLEEMEIVNNIKRCFYMPTEAKYDDKQGWNL